VPTQKADLRKTSDISNEGEEEKHKVNSQIPPFRPPIPQ
jgi:hypothetical protein